VQSCCRNCDARSIVNEARSAAAAYDLDYKVVLAVIATESNFNHKAYNASGDHGIAQFNYRLALDYRVPIEHLYSYKVGIWLMTKHLANLKGRSSNWICRYHVGAYGSLVGARLRRCNNYKQKVQSITVELNKHYNQNRKH